MLAYVARGMLEVSLDDHRLPLELASMLACMLAYVARGMLEVSLDYHNVGVCGSWNA